MTIDDFDAEPKFGAGISNTCGAALCFAAADFLTPALIA
jgi:hypothetical protein